MLTSIARAILRLGGWTMIMEAPLPPRAVFIAAPHTSNWDGFWALVYKVANRLDIRWFAKESLFWFPLSIILRSMGGIPLDRSRAGTAVSRAVELFADSDSFYFGLAPEGTRRKVDYWKTGFYRIAEEARVPIVLGFLDYGKRRLGLGPALLPTGDRQRDLAFVRDFYRDIEARWPDKVSPVEFPPA